MLMVIFKNKKLHTKEHGVRKCAECYLVVVRVIMFRESRWSFSTRSPNKPQGSLPHREKFDFFSLSVVLINQHVFYLNTRSNRQLHGR